MFEVLLPSDWVMEEALLIQRHRVDCEVTSSKVSLKRAVGVPRQGILFVGLGVKEHTEGATNLGEAQAEKLVSTGVEHQPVPVHHGPSEEFVSNCTAYKEDLHRTAALRPLKTLDSGSDMQAETDDKVGWS